MAHKNYMTYIYTNYRQVYLSIPNELIDLILFKRQNGIYSSGDLEYMVLNDV